ncbi:hypothetical protein [Flavobacterium sp. FlaQc-47]|uniref:hypothetical protein n=1 Tax=Flavobacterium sp. FlaQc-47 TaxID=3374180 RepID=UPI0037579986
MIKVERVDCPNLLKWNEIPQKEGEIETRDSILFFNDISNHNSKYQKMGIRGARIKESYSAYSDKTVRKVLKEMFNGKCAYCESKISAIYNGDIEHFRPKGGYNDMSGQPLINPGYYWLASEWENLLFACPFCNQTNTQEIFDGINTREVVQGKLNQFPLLTNTYRLNYNDGNNYINDKSEYEKAFNLEESERLLLKPCTDIDVEKHFKYDDLGLIYKNAGLNSLEENRAETSIKVYALQRLGLIQTRKEKVIQIKAQIRRVEQALLNYNKYLDKSEEENIWFEGILRDEMKILKAFKNSDQEYAGLARYIIEKYFNAFII